MREVGRRGGGEVRMNGEILERWSGNGRRE